MPRKKSTNKPSATPPPPPGAATGTELPPPGQMVDVPPGESLPQVEVINVAESDTVTVTNHQISLDLPVMVLPGHCRQRIDVRMSREAAKGWKAYAHGLEKQEARLKSGKFVRDAPDAIRYMGEQIAEQL